MNLPKPFAHSLFPMVPAAGGKRVPLPAQGGRRRRGVLPRHPAQRGAGPCPAVLARLWVINRLDEKNVSSSLVELYLISGVIFPFQRNRSRCHRKEGDNLPFRLSGSKGFCSAEGCAHTWGCCEKRNPFVSTRVMLHNTDTCRFRFHSHVLFICKDDLCRVVISVDFVYL